MTAEGRVIVVGSINMDLVATTDRYPTLGETTMGNKLRYVPGGKGSNQAIGAARSGAPTVMVGAVGTDLFGSQLTDYLREQGVNVDHVNQVAGSSGAAVITLVEGVDNAIVVIPGANSSVTSDALHDLNIGPSDVVVTQLEIPLATVRATLAHADAVGARSVVNPSPAFPCVEDIVANASVTILNETELAWFSRGDVSLATQDIPAVTDMAQLLRSPNQTIVVTLGPAGVLIADEAVTHVPGRPAEVVDTTGAGDTFAGALSAELARGSDMATAVRFAVVASSLACEVFGAGPSMPTREQTLAALDSAH